jgi:prepilin-type N-terminal cleavage/methylation domain-containing protein
MVGARAGFSLPEALIALTISSVLVILVGAVFLVQNDFFSQVLMRTQVHENARAMTEVVASEIRSIGGGGVLVADSANLVIRAPLVTGIVCGAITSDVTVYLPGGTSTFSTSEVAGFGVLDSSGTWVYRDRTWSTLNASGGNPTLTCAGNGADTVGASASFLRLQNVDDDLGVAVASLKGSPILLFRKTAFELDDSALVPGGRALYRGLQGGTMTELTTGLTADAHFEYWTGSSWSKSVSGAANLNAITRVRLTAESVGRGESSRQASFEFGWTVDIPLANAL